MLIPKVIEDIKGMLIERRVLQARRDEYGVRVRKANDFFTQLFSSKPIDTNQLSEGVALFQKILFDIYEIDKKIWEIDSAVISFMEIETIDQILRVTAPDKVNDAGDMVQNQTFHVVSHHSSTDLVEVTPEDLFALRSIRATFGINNVEVIDKKKYYNSANFNTFTMAF